MDRMRALECFLEVAECGSFSKAAKALGAPPSSISRAIQNLEAELGATLIHRTTRVVKLTELGALYRDQIRPAVSALSNAAEIVREQPHAPAGVLRVTATPGYGGFLLMPALKKLRRRHPQITVDIDLTDQLSNLTAHEVDLAIRATANPPERSVARKLSDNRVVLVASPVYLARFGTPRRLSDLYSHRTLLYRRPNSVLHWQAKTAEGWREIETDPAFVCNMGEALVDEAIDGGGLALLPEWGVAQHLEDGRLVSLSLTDAALSVSRDPDLGIYLLYHRPKYQLKKVKVAVDFLLSELTGGEPGEDHDQG